MKKHLNDHIDEANLHFPQADPDIQLRIYFCNSCNQVFKDSKTIIRHFLNTSKSQSHILPTISILIYDPQHMNENQDDPNIVVGEDQIQQPAPDNVVPEQPQINIEIEQDPFVIDRERLHELCDTQFHQPLLLHDLPMKKDLFFVKRHVCKICKNDKFKYDISTLRKVLQSSRNSRFRRIYKPKPVDNNQENKVA